jgi:Ni/Co efflux regulator RcnB
MRSRKFSGVALAALMAAQPAMAAIDSATGAPSVPGPVDPAVGAPLPPPTSGSMGGGDQRRNAVPPVGTSQQAAVPEMPPPPPRPVMARRAMSAPSAYVRPAYGYQLPQYWMTDEFYISDPRSMGLGRPAPGFGWSRYYDDMVLTDQWGRVYDVQSRSDWDRHDGRRGSSHDGDAALAGIGGAAVGAVAGNLIAGAGSRLAGSLIGGGVGALAGLAIETATSKHRRSHNTGHDRRGGYDNDYYRDRYHGAHWGSSYGYTACGCGDEVVTTTVTRTSWAGGGVMVPRQVVMYENVYAPIAAPTKMRPVEGKDRRTTKVRPRVRGDY